MNRAHWRSFNLSALLPANNACSSLTKASSSLLFCPPDGVRATHSGICCKQKTGGGGACGGTVPRFGVVKMGSDRRHIREQYTELIDLTKEDNDTSNNNVSKIKQILKKANILHEGIEKPREHARDTDLLQHLAVNALSVAKMNMGSRTNTPKDIVQCLKTAFLPGWRNGSGADLEDLDWKRMGQFSAPYFRTAPAMSCLLGPLMDIEPATRKASERRERQEVAELVNPDVVADAAACSTEKQETDKNMEEMLTVLRQLKKVRIGRLILNPRSFAQTVENIFTLSFLVKDARATIEEDEGEPSGSELVVCLARKDAPAPRPEADGAAAPTPLRGQRQFVSTFSMPTWERMKTRIKQQDCLIKHRTRVRAAAPLAAANGAPSAGAKRGAAAHPKENGRSAKSRRKSKAASKLDL